MATNPALPRPVPALPETEAGQPFPQSRKGVSQAAMAGLVRMGLNQFSPEPSLVKSPAQLRRQEILKQLRDRGQVTVAGLSAALDVSNETVRGDLKNLESHRSLIRVHGGAIPRPLEKLSFFSRANESVMEKQNIAMLAVTLVGPRDRLFLDASSTCCFLAQELLGLDNLTIITDSVRVVSILASNSSHRIICVGGALMSSSFSLVGPSAVESIERYHANIFFCSCTGVSQTHGATESDEFEIEVKQAMANRAERTILLADRHKFGRVGLSRFLGLEDIDLIVTDSPDEELQASFPKILTC